jgi:hypothetical protein
LIKSDFENISLILEPPEGQDLGVWKYEHLRYITIQLLPRLLLSTCNLVVFEKLRAMYAGLSCHPTLPTFSYFSSTFLLFLFFIKNCLIFLLFLMKSYFFKTAWESVCYSSRIIINKLMKTLSENAISDYLEIPNIQAPPPVNQASYAPVVWIGVWRSQIHALTRITHLNCVAAEQMP